VRDEPNYYITAQSTKRNPDLLIPGGPIKGNAYRRKLVDLEDKQESCRDEEGDKEESSAPQTDDLFSRLQQQANRYYHLDSNPTIKCHRCREFGHMARACPNGQVRLNCILCGQDNHESYDCTAKLCFKCN